LKNVAKSTAQDRSVLKGCRSFVQIGDQKNFQKKRIQPEKSWVFMEGQLQDVTYHQNSLGCHSAK